MKKKGKMTGEENNDSQLTCDKSEMSDAQCFDYFNAKRLTMTSNVVAITVGILFFAFGIGYIVDMVLGTSPWFVFIFIILSFPLAQIVIFKRLRCVLGSGKCAQVDNNQ